MFWDLRPSTWTSANWSHENLLCAEDLETFWLGSESEALLPRVKPQRICGNCATLCSPVQLPKYAAPDYSTLYHTILHRTTPYYAMSYHVVSCRVIPYHNILCHVIPCTIHVPCTRVIGKDKDPHLKTLWTIALIRLNKLIWESIRLDIAFIRLDKLKIGGLSLGGPYLSLWQRLGTKVTRIVRTLSAEISAQGPILRPIE